MDWVAIITISVSSGLTGYAFARVVDIVREHREYQLEAVYDADQLEQDLHQAMQKGHSKEPQILEKNTVYVVDEETFEDMMARDFDRTGMH